jgi:ferredoxin
MGRLIYLKNVVTLTLDQDKCMGCGTCLFVCPHAVLSLTDGKVEIANRDACMECGACARNCPVEALAVQSGVGCATAVINARLGRKSACCCSLESSGEQMKDVSGCSSGSDQLRCG